MVSDHARGARAARRARRRDAVPARPALHDCRARARQRRQARDAGVGGAPASRPLSVHLVDVSAAALDLATRTRSTLHDVDIVTHQATYESGLAEATSRRRRGGRLLALFLGSNIGNFDPPGADAFLRTIRAALAPGDALLLGTDLVKPERDAAAGLRRSARRDRGVQPQPAGAHQPRARRRTSTSTRSRTARCGTPRRRAWRCTSCPRAVSASVCRARRLSSNCRRARRSGPRARTSTSRIRRLQCCRASFGSRGQWVDARPVSR